MSAVGDVLLRQSGDGHGRFALPVNLRQTRAEAIERGERILDIHGRAAPDQRADVVGIHIGRTGDQALDHRGRGKHRHARPGIEQRDDFLRLECATLRHHLHAQPRDMLHDVNAGAMTHRRGMQDGIPRCHRIDLAAIGEARHHKIVMREHGALRASGRSGRIEQPGEIASRARHNVDRICRKQHLVFRAANCDQPLETFRRMRSDLGVDTVRGKANARAGMFEDKP